MTNMKSAEKLFLAFLLTKNLDNIPTCPFALNDVLCGYWPSLRTVKNEDYSANSLSTIRQLLRPLILKKTDVDILVHPSLKPQRDVFDNFLKVLKNKGKGTVKHFAEIPEDDMKKVVSSLDITNPTQLQHLAWWYLQLFFCRRGRENTHDMLKSDLVFEAIEGKMTIRLGRIVGTKNHKEISEDANSGGTICEIKGNPKCPVSVLQLYLSKLHPDIEWLWQRPSTRLVSQNDPIWYEKSKVGANKLGEMMKNISAKCALSKSFTNHSVRVSACTRLGELGFSDLDIQAVSKHKSVDSLGLYKRTKMARKVDMATHLANSIGLSAVPMEEPIEEPIDTPIQEPIEEELSHSHQPNLDEMPILTQYMNQPSDDLPDLGAIENFLQCGMAPSDQATSRDQVASNQVASNQVTSNQVTSKKGQSVVFNNCANITIQFL